MISIKIRFSIHQTNVMWHTFYQVNKKLIHVIYYLSKVTHTKLIRVKV